MLKPELTIYDYTRILKKRKWIILITTLLVVGFTGVFTMMQKNLYRTSAVVMSGDKDIAPDLFGGYYNSVNLHTEAKLVVSTPVLNKAIDRIFRIKHKLSEEKRAELISKIRKMIRTRVSPETKTIEIVVSGGDPKLISRIANEVSITYCNYSVVRRKQDISENFEFLQKQLKYYQAEFDKYEEKIQKFKEEEGIVNINDELRSKLNLAASISSQLANVVAEKRTIEERLKQFHKSRGKDRVMSLGDDRIGGVIKKLNEQLINLEIKRLRLSELYKDNHPKIKNIDLAVTVIKSQINKQLSRAYNSEELRLMLELSVKEAKIKALRLTEKELNGKISKLPRKKAILVRMEKKSKFIENMVNIFTRKLEEAKIFSTEKDGQRPTIIQKAAVTKKAVKPDPVFNMMVGLFAGFVAGIFLAFFVESVDVSVSTIDEVENYVNLSVLGVIPYTNTDNVSTKKGADTSISKKCVLHHDPRSICSEAFRILRTNMHFMAMGNKKMFMVASSLPGEGKSFVSVNLAITFAQLGAAVILCDYNLRDPELHSYFGISKNPGITDIVVGDMNWREAVRETKITNLDILCFGPIPPNPSELILSKQCTDLLEDIREDYDIVILDSSPLIPVTDGAILSNKVDMTILVHNAIKTSMMVLLRVKGQLNSVKSVIGGVVLNQLKSTILMDPDVPINYYYAKKKDVA